MDDRARVEALLGRPPQGEFDVVVRTAAGDPVVLRNAPLLDDGTPMPTRYYLVDTELVRAVSRVEADGGVRRAEAAIPAAAIASTHDAYARERDAALPADHEGPRPSGGVGGTRRGVKCLHAHLANLLAGADDPVGRWTADALAAHGHSLDGLATGPPSTADAGSGGGAATTADAAGSLVVDVADDRVAIAMAGGGSWALPIGVRTLLDAELRATDPPRPEHLTNALGLVHDHLDDVIRAAPSVLAVPSVTASGAHAAAVARVEIGSPDLPPDYRLERAAADEVFRTLVAEPTVERRFNPGLADDDVETVVATMCILLTFMRRLGLDEIGIDPIGTDGR